MTLVENHANTLAFARITSQDSCCQRRTPATENVHCSIRVAVMNRSTVTAHPFSYSKARDTFRPRIGQQATIRAGLGGKSFVYFQVPCAMPNGLVRKHVSEGRPASVQDGLGHIGLCQGRCVDITNHNQSEALRDCGGMLMVKIAPLIPNLYLDRCNPALLIRFLSDDQRSLRVAIDSLRFNSFAGRKRREVFQAKVNSNFGRCLGRGTHIIDFNTDIQKPATQGVAGEAAAVFNFPLGQFAAVKNAIHVAAESKAAFYRLNRRTGQRNPFERPFDASVTQEWLVFYLPTVDIFSADRFNRMAVQPEFRTGARGQSTKIECGQPGPAVSQRVFLPIVAKIPDEINRPRLAVQLASTGFNAVSVGQDHELIVHTKEQ